jgi:hypothetical protein
MIAPQLLDDIADYCRRAGMAESTFGRRVVNDGKLVQRLRQGRRVTTDTLERIRAFLDNGTFVESASAATPVGRVRAPGDDHAVSPDYA